MGRNHNVFEDLHFTCWSHEYSYTRQSMNLVVVVGRGMSRMSKTTATYIAKYSTYLAQTRTLEVA